MTIGIQPIPDRLGRFAGYLLAGDISYEYGKGIRMDIHFYLSEVGDCLAQKGIIVTEMIQCLIAA
jgi:hypothetical protein